MSSDLTNIWRGKLGKLTEYRHGNHYLPDDAEGRAMLIAFLRCRLSADDAKQRAPWLTDSELKQLQRKARKIADIKQLGALIGLEYDERMACKVFFLEACDITREEALRRQAERNRENGRRRQIKFRESRMKMRHTAKRDDAVMRMLRMLPRTPAYEPLSGWTQVSALVKEAKRCKAFRRADGRPLRNPRDAVYSVLKKLKAHDQIEMTEQRGARGTVLMVRLTDLESSGNRYGFSDCRSVGRENQPKPTTTQGLSGKNGLSRCVVDKTQLPDTASVTLWRRMYAFMVGERPSEIVHPDKVAMLIDAGLLSRTGDDIDITPLGHTIGRTSTATSYSKKDAVA